jgi:hypothetical protein
MSVKLKFPLFIRAMAVIMLFAMFHYVAGYRLMYSLGMLYAKNEAKEYVTENNNNIQKLTLSASDYNSLKWSEANKEFSDNKQMYDVVSIEKSGDTYCISVYADEPETELITAFHNFEKELFHPDQSAKGTKSAEDIMSSFQKDCTPENEFKIDIFAIIGVLQPSLADQQHSFQVPNNIWHPPLQS